jgi:hypothetical protein
VRRQNSSGVRESALGESGQRSAVGRTALRIATAGITLALCLAGAEGVVRVSGRRPWTDGPAHANEPTMMRPDPVLGWRTKPGEYVYPGYTPRAPSIRMTVWPDGSRATRSHDDARSRRMILVGDSFTQGWAVSDDETWAWNIQARWPGFDVRNHGTGGYSTYQSLLLLEDLLNRPDPLPEVVLYGFSDHHENRNVAEASWLRSLAANNRAGARLTLPFCTLGPTGPSSRTHLRPTPSRRSAACPRRRRRSRTRGQAPTLAIGPAESVA